MRVVHAPGHVRHVPPFEVSSGQVGPAWEIPARAEAILTALAADDGFSFEEPTSFGDAPILAVHDPGLLHYLGTAWQAWADAEGPVAPLLPDVFPLPGLREGMGPAPEPVAPGGRIGAWCFDTATAVVAGTYEAARDAVDVALSAARHVLEGAPAVYGLCRPPGHHAARAAFGGYCYLNNAAIASEWLAARTGGPVDILDLDFHHGNGTQQIFWERPDVGYVSIHADPNRMYPFFAGYADEIGGGRGRGATLNLPQPAGVTDIAYLAELDRTLEWLSGRPGGPIVVSLGLDTYGLDPICDFALTTPAYHEVGRRVAALGRPLVILQEGGYHVADLGGNVRSWLRGAEGRPPGR